MLIGGLQKFSLIDYPKKIAAIVFTQGCSFLCHFCHNPSLVIKEQFTPPLSEKDFFSFLEKRKNKLEGVVISGGEPTLQKDLIEFIKKIKNFGFLVKLDTNGTNPEVLKFLIEKKLIDYIAMDIKASFKNYEKVIGRKINLENIKKSIKLIMDSEIDYEFRTTLVKNLHTKEDVLEILKSIKGSKVYILQSFRKEITLNPKFSSYSAFSDEEMQDFKKKALQCNNICRIR